MPNWATNIVTIEGKKETIEAIVAKGAEGFYTKYDWNIETRKNEEVSTHANKFSFENFVPTPPKALESEAWFMWRVNQWGTKWDITQDGLMMDITNDHGDTWQIRMVFSTAWSPALELFTKLSDMYAVQIDYKYWEEGMCFIGQAFIEEGECSDESFELDEEIYERAGAVFTVDEDGNREMDWDTEYDLEKVFPL